MSLFDTFRNLFGKVKASPVERTVADMISDRVNVVDDKFPSRVDGSPFVAGSSYFGVRLSGLHMVDARRFATEQLPLCVCLAEFDHAGQRRTVPFSVGPDAIRSKLRAAGVTEKDEPQPTWIELRDLTVVRPTPFTGTNLSLYAGLFSVAGTDLVRNLLNVVGTVGTAIGQPMIGAGVKVAETVYNSFGSLLALDEVRQLSAALIGNALTEAGSGYLLIANVSSQTFDPRRGRVVGGRLHWPTDVKGGAPVVEFDHALLALEQYKTIVEKSTGLAPELFQTLWLAALAGTKEQSATALSKLVEAVASSPDVTEEDRYALIVAYKLQYEKIATVRGWLETTATGRSSGALLFQDRLSEMAGEKNIRPQHKAALNAISTIDLSANAQPRLAAGTPEDGDFDAVLQAAQAVRRKLAKFDPADAKELSAIIGRAALSPLQHEQDRQ